MEALLDKVKRDILIEYEKNNNIVQELVLEKNDLLDEANKKILKHETKISQMTKQISDLTHECKNYENVSIHKNLAKQISEKDNEIRILENRLSTFEKKYNTLNEKYEKIILQKDTNEVDANEVDTNEVDNVDEDEEIIEVEFYEKRLKPKNGKGRILFLITDDEQKDIYERLEDGEPGEHIGKLVGKNNRPHFF